MGIRDRYLGLCSVAFKLSYLASLKVWVGGPGFAQGGDPKGPDGIVVISHEIAIQQMSQDLRMS